ncbi:MAG TPA: asparagine synthase-related protein [Gemmatimonadaceae bacterium]|nr:asparagine synthase-related protein [Gemmatimonadaceae bacterium]
MPGLFGIIAKTPALGADQLRAMAQRMADAMRRQPWMLTELWTSDAFCGGRVHLGVLNPDPQPLGTAGGRALAWFDGETYAPSANDGATPTAEEIVRDTDAAGAGLAKLDGVYTLARYTPATNELVIANDRLGFRPLYWTETDTWFAYAAEVKSLLAIRETLPAVDELAVAQFLSFDYMLGERTWWRGIELLPPASLWRISPTGIDRHPYWSFSCIRRDVRDVAEVREEFGRLWSTAIRQRIKPGITPLLLSGGLDSRALLAEMRAQGSDLATITFGSEECSDMRIARQCAQIAGVPHRALALSAENWWHRREEAIWQTDGLVNAMHLHVAIAMDEMHTGNQHTLKNSTGDTLFGGSKLREPVADWTRAPGDLLDRMYLGNPFFTRGDVTEASLGDCARYLCGPSSDCFAISQRQRRMILTGPLALSAHCEVVNPGVGLAMLHLMLGALPDAERRGSRFYNRVLAERYPAYFANVPWQLTGRGLAESFPVRARRGVRARLARRLRLRENPYGGRFADYPAFVRASDVRERLLQSDLLLDQTLGGAVRRALASADGAPVDARTELAILTAEVYLRQAEAGSTSDAHSAAVVEERRASCDAMLS